MWDKKNPWVADYISIPVMPAISPAHAVLALASTMCFSTPIVTDKGQTFGKGAKWWVGVGVGGNLEHTESSDLLGMVELLRRQWSTGGHVCNVVVCS